MVADLSLARRAPKRDANEGGIVEALRSAGYVVYQLSDEGVPDLLVTRPGRAFLLLEVKAIGKTLTTAQERFFEQTQGCPRFMVTSAEDALAAARYWLGGSFDA